MPIFQPVECNDLPKQQCKGVPVQKYNTVKEIKRGLARALRKLIDCQQLHAELMTCVQKHDEKAKAK